jgi:hypothetical protein
MTKPKPSSPKSSAAAKPDPIRALSANLRAALPDLKKLLEECTNHWGYEDPVYRYYHQSFKLYRLQDVTAKIVQRLQVLAPDRQLNALFMQIVEEGTGKTFQLADNQRWSEVTRPIVEAFFHARYFLEMAVRHGGARRRSALSLPSGWAAFLYLYDLR